MVNKVIKTALPFFLFLTLSIFLVYASPGYMRLCLSEGQSIPPDSPDPYYTCTWWMCTLCVNEGSYLPAAPYKCYDIAGCQTIGDLDEDPPDFDIQLPTQDATYNSRYVPLDVKVNEKSSIYYLDNVYGRGIWTSLCSKCYGYNSTKYFRDGLNNITFKAVDMDGNDAYHDVVFIIDSKKPVIRDTLPRGSTYVGSEFLVEYDEDNPEEIKLHYGNLVKGYKEAILTDCPSGTRQQCSVDISLSDYDNSEIEYWFSIEDLAGNIAESRKVIVKVDETSPVINNLDYTIDGRYALFDIDVTELNLAEISYIDNNDERPRLKRLCSSLVDGRCSKRVSFRDGLHEVDIQVTDKAGNSVGEHISFFTDSKEPRITRTEPTRGFADGNFELQFSEENPKSIILHYGNSETEYRNKEVDIVNECYEERRRQYCSTKVDLKDYDGQEIEYWFDLIDIVDNSVESRHTILAVDTTYPVINNLEYSIDRYYVYFDIDITEENLYGVEYYDHSESTPRWKRICSILYNGKCEKKVYFGRGLHDVDIQVTDKAGNSVGENIDFEIDY